MISDLPSHSMFQNKLAITCVQNILEIIIFGVNRGRGQKSISLDFVKMFKTLFRMQHSADVNIFYNIVLLLRGSRITSEQYSIFGI